MPTCRNGVPPPEPYNPDPIVTSSSRISWSDFNNTRPSSTSSGVTAISTLKPMLMNMVQNYNTFYKVVKDNTCYGIELVTFYAWNPAVERDRSGLQADVYACVGVSATTARRIAVLAVWAVNEFEMPPS
ncbi:hypothetical protein F5X99DRAFT_425199 [Biscogniauxia marginata]|nr:hypothetical protein F5X99DRAFT_425199 [Biscogniauxia marginata]